MRTPSGSRRSSNRTGVRTGNRSRNRSSDRASDRASDRLVDGEPTLRRSTRYRRKRPIELQEWTDPRADGADEPDAFWKLVAQAVRLGRAAGAMILRALRSSELTQLKDALYRLVFAIYDIVRTWIDKRVQQQWQQQQREQRKHAADDSQDVSLDPIERRRAENLRDRNPALIDLFKPDARPQTQSSTDDQSIGFDLARQQHHRRMDRSSTETHAIAGSGSGSAAAPESGSDLASAAGSGRSGSLNDVTDKRRAYVPRTVRKAKLSYKQSFKLAIEQNRSINRRLFPDTSSVSKDVLTERRPTLAVKNTLGGQMRGTPTAWRIMRLQQQKPPDTENRWKSDERASLEDFINRVQRESNVKFTSWSQLVRKRIERDAEIERIREKTKPKKELTEKELQRIHDALTAPATADTLISKFSIEIMPHDIQTLAERTWLNDSVINFYFQLILERADARAAKDKSAPKVFCFNTFFYPSLLQRGYSAVRRWAKRQKVVIADVDYVLIPIHLGVHWCLGVINAKKQRIEYWDSIDGSPGKAFQLLKTYYRLETGESIEHWQEYIEEVMILSIPLVTIMCVCIFLSHTAHCESRCLLNNFF